MNQVSIGISLANTHELVDADEVYSFIESQEGDFQTFKLVPPPGVIFGASLDYMLLLNIAGSAASVASILWMAYEKFIAPRKNKDDSAGIVIMIQKDNGTTDQFWIGHNDKSIEIFIQTFSNKVENIKHSELPEESTSHRNYMLQTESIWIRRK